MSEISLQAGASTNGERKVALREGLRLEEFLPEIQADGTPSDRTVGFLNAMRSGFYEKRASAEELRRTGTVYANEPIGFVAVYDDAAQETDEFSYSGLFPIATFGHYEKSFNIGGPELVPAHLITMVTVAASHRRQGILSAMMRHSLDAAVEAGRPVALLTASESTIYGRFGFGIATREVKYELNCAGGLRFKSPSVGTVTNADPSKIGDVAATIFARAHAQNPGSVDRQGTYLEYKTGRWSDDVTVPNRTLRALIYRGPSGEPEGFVTYAFNGWGWKPPTIGIRNFVAASDSAELALWEHLANLDLIEKIVWPKAPVDTALFYALEDSGALNTVNVDHHLWVRVLDVPRALTSRSWLADGDFSLRIRDRWGYAEGTFSVSIRGGVASVRLVDNPDPAADMELDVATLGALMLGDTSVSQLVRAGLIDVNVPPAKLDALWTTAVKPFCNTGF